MTLAQQLSRARPLPHLLVGRMRVHRLWPRSESPRNVGFHGLHAMVCREPTSRYAGSWSALWRPTAKVLPSDCGYPREWGVSGTFKSLVKKALL